MTGFDRSQARTGARRGGGAALAATITALGLYAGDARAQQAEVAPQPAPQVIELGAIAVRPRGPTPVHFLAYRGEDSYTVRVGNVQCSTPCTLPLPPGPTTVRASGSGELVAQLVVPHLAAQVRLSHGAPAWYMPAGATLVPLGIVVASALWTVGLACRSGGCYVANFVAWPVLGVAMLVTGSALLGIANRPVALDANRPEILDARARPRLRLRDVALGPTEQGVFAAASFVF